MTASSTNANHASEFGGKRVLVTGGTKGAGKAIASRFLQGGATVVITARSGPAEKQQLISYRRTSRLPKVRRMSFMRC
jgi:NAD(P)-dependent dehydrogenase (short-subunit alcohol dehydrogenase family)